MPRSFRFDLQSGRLSELEAYPKEAALDFQGRSALVFSTKPYPDYVVESMTMAHSMAFAKLFGPVFVAPEPIDLMHSLVSVSVRSQLQTYLVPTEPMDLSHSIASGELRQVLKLHSFQPEPMDFNHSMVSGTLKVVLIPYLNWIAESMDMNHSLVLGALA